MPKRFIQSGLLSILAILSALWIWCYKAPEVDQLLRGRSSPHYHAPMQINGHARWLIYAAKAEKRVQFEEKQVTLEVASDIDARLVDHPDS
jgi:hypothetical protein